MESKVNVNNIFSSIASRYDTLNTLLSFNFDRGWRKKAIAICNLKEGQKALDLCCGTGAMIAPISKRVGKASEVVGLDFNEKMLKVGRERLAQDIEGYSFRLIQGDCQNLPFKDNSFDCITIAFGLRNIPDKMKALSEMYRVLKPGRKLVCLELSNPEGFFFKRLYGIYFTYLLPVIGYIGTKDRKAYFYLRDSVKGFMSKKELKQAFEKTGFKESNFVSLTGGTASIHYGCKA